MAHKSPELEDHKRVEMSQQQVSSLAAVLLMLIFFAFNVGVFWGKKSVLEISQPGLTSDVFADTLYTALCGIDGPAFLQDITNTHDGGVYIKELDLLNCKEKEKSVEHAQEQASGNESAHDCENEEVTKKDQLEKEYYCVQLAGFATLQEARLSVQEAAASGIRVVILERVSKSASGLSHLWYQIITEPVLEKSELDSLRERLEHLLKVRNSMVRVISNEQKDMLLGKERRTV